jgi:hypothetical protein
MPGNTAPGASHTLSESSSISSLEVFGTYQTTRPRCLPTLVAPFEQPSMQPLTTSRGPAVQSGNHQPDYCESLPQDNTPATQDVSCAIRHQTGEAEQTIRTTPDDGLQGIGYSGILPNEFLDGSELTGGDWLELLSMDVTNSDISELVGVQKSNDLGFVRQQVESTEIQGI